MRRAIALGAAAICLAAPAAAGAASYSNPTPLGPADNAPLLPYPSSIAVAGEQGTTVNVTATLVGVAGAAVRDLDALLVGPGGRSILLSDACSNAVIPDWTGGSVTLDDNASASIPDPCPIGGTPSGTVRPVDFNAGLADNFPSLPPPYPTGLSVFRGVSPNGLWSLYVVDDSGPEALTVGGGWRLDVTTTGPAAPTATKKKKCKRKRKRKNRASILSAATKTAAGSKRKRCKRKKKRR